MISKEESKYSSYYILSPTRKLSTLQEKSCNDANKLCNTLRWKLKINNFNRNVFPLNLDLSSDQLKDIKDGSMLYVCGHGNPQCIGISEQDEMFTPETFANKLAAKLNKEANISIKFDACQLGLSGAIADKISKKYKKKFFDNVKSDQSFVERFAIQMQKKGYFHLTVYGYLGKTLIGKEKSQEKNHSYVFLGESEAQNILSSSNIPEGTRRAKNAKLKFITSKEGVQSILDYNDQATQYMINKKSKPK